MSLIVSADYYYETEKGYEFDPRKLPQAHGECLKGFTEEILCSYEHGFYPVVIVMSGIPGSGKSYIAEKLLREAKSEGHNLLVVDNTNLSAWEASPYIALANAYSNVTPKILRVDTPFHLCAKRQTHNVPLNNLRAMHERFLKPDFPPFWKVETVKGH